MRSAALVTLTRALGALLLGAVLLGAGLLGWGPCGARAEDDSPPYAPGPSSHEIEGLQTELVVPGEIGAEKASLIVVLHGAGGTATGMAGSFAPWAQDGYVVCAPKSRGDVWEVDDLRRVLRIAAHLKEVLPIDPAKIHVVGFSNGGWNLPALAFDDELRPCSATWIAAGYRGGNVPDWAKKGLGAIALAGTEDANLGAARATVPALEGKVRSVEVRTEEGLGHAFPRTLMPYLQWWMGVQEGRLVPGEDLSFAWTEDLDAAIAALAGAKKGGVFVWLYTAEDAAKDEARAIQHEVFFDPEVRFLGGQLACVKLDAAGQAERREAWRVKNVPALVVLDKAGKVKKVFDEKIKASKVARTLRGVAPTKRPAKD